MWWHHNLQETRIVMSGRAVLGLIGVLVMLMGSTAALSAPEEEWTEPENLSGWQAGVIDQRLEVGEDGTRAAFWLARDGGGKWALWVRVRPPGGSWGASTNLSGWHGYLEHFLPTYWDAAVDAGGSVVAMWVAIDSAETGDNVAVRTARRLPDGSWQIITLSNGYETGVRAADLRLGPGADLAAAWVACASHADLAQGPCHVRVRRKPAEAETWLPVEHADQTVSGEGISEAHVLVGPGGLTTALWLQADSSTPANWAVMARTYSPTPAPGAWDPSPHNLSGWKKSIELSAPVADPGGTVTTAWNTFSSDPAKKANYASTRAAGNGSWSGAVAISGLLSGYGLYAPTLVAGQDGTVAAVWAYRAQATESYFLGNVRDAGSVWGGETELYGRSSLLIGDWALGVWPDGSAIVVYSLIDPGHDPAEHEKLRWAVRGSRGNWSGEGELTGWLAGIRGPALGLGDDGSAVAVWGLEDASRPANLDYAILAATWPPGGTFRPPIQISDWWAHVRLRPGATAGGDKGAPAAALWKTMRTDPLSEAVYYAELLTAGHTIFVPLGLHRSP
jgi:hypothetical protein